MGTKNPRILLNTEPFCDKSVSLNGHCLIAALIAQNPLQAGFFLLS